ncbi:MAG: amidohydrolase family protein [Dehalococcoidia bacterium]|nr:amidohydrolase family protein [Dehalococcoidia bacterium]|tara:strand:+ start:3548 stop:4336 length:789 start_codon:yes stop_codon:yes gene_type:complete
MIIDTHCHAGQNWFLPIESLEFEMNQVGVDAAVLIQHGGTYNNDYLFEEAAKRGDRFKVVVMVDPTDPDPLGTLEKLAGQGAAGVRIAPDGAFDALSDVTDIWRRAGELGLAISSLGNAKQFSAPTFKKIIDDCPDTQIVIEHLAGVGITDPPYTDYESALKCAQRPNITLKVPGLGEITRRPPILLPDFRFDNIPPLFEMAHEAFGADRMMWGSDYPPSAGREGYGNALEGVRNHPAFAMGDDVDWVLGGTAARVWGFDKG